MSMRDPGLDPERERPYRNLDPDMGEPYRTLPEGRSGGGAWGWILGAVAVLLIIGFIFGWGHNTQVASNAPTPPSATTTPARPMTPAAPGMSPMAPRPAPSTTGQGGQ